MSYGLEPAPIDMVRGRVILEGVSGSTSAGMLSTAESREYVGIFVVPMEVILGLRQINPVTTGENPSRTYWELRKFCELALSGRPQALELLWAAHTRHDQFGEELVLKRRIFLSARAIDSYASEATELTRAAARRYGHPEYAGMAKAVWRMLIQCSQLAGTGEMKFNMRGRDLDAVEDAADMTADELVDAVQAEIRRIRHTTVVLPDEPDVRAVHETIVGIRRTIDRETPVQPLSWDHKDERRVW